MTTTIDTTVGGANSNSYATKAQASAEGGYFDSRLFTLATNWTGATVDNRNNALIMATRLLDEWVEWDGYLASEAQALRWPRYNVQDRDDQFTFDSDIIPQFLINATSELAGHLLGSSDITGNPDTLGFKKLKVASLELEVDNSDRDQYGAIPDSVRVIVEPFGKIRRRGGGGVHKLARS